MEHFGCFCTLSEGYIVYYCSCQSPLKNQKFRSSNIEVSYLSLSLLSEGVQYIQRCDV